MHGPRSYPKAARLRRRREFLSLQRAGRRRHTPHLVVIQQPGRTSTTRFGVTASTRIGNAVVRNRVKRLMREVFRHHRAALASPIDLVVIAKPGADVLTYEQAAIEFAQALDLERA